MACSYVDGVTCYTSGGFFSSSCGVTEEGRRENMGTNAGRLVNMMSVCMEVPPTASVFSDGN